MCAHQHVSSSVTFMDMRLSSGVIVSTLSWVVVARPANPKHHAEGSRPPPPPDGPPPGRPPPPPPGGPPPPPPFAAPPMARTKWPEQKAMPSRRPTQPSSTPPPWLLGPRPPATPPPRVLLPSPRGGEAMYLSGSGVQVYAEAFVRLLGEPPRGDDASAEVVQIFIHP